MEVDELTIDDVRFAKEQIKRFVRAINGKKDEFKTPDEMITLAHIPFYNDMLDKCELMFGQYEFSEIPDIKILCESISEFNSILAELVPAQKTSGVNYATR
jgi:hypothetical protein